MAVGDFIPLQRKAVRRRKSKYRCGWIVAENGCHVWQGIRDRGGYGRVWDEMTQAPVLVHRLRYQREVGPIPDGLVLDHLCDNGPGGCCNPAHLRPTTAAENGMRSLKHHIHRTHCPKGHPYSGDNLFRTKTGRACRACMNARSAQAYRERREERKAKAAEYRTANRASIRAHANAARARDRERVNARRRELREIAKREGRTA